MPSVWEILTFSINTSALDVAQICDMEKMRCKQRCAYHDVCPRGHWDEVKDYSKMAAVLCGLVADSFPVKTVSDLHLK